MSEIIVNQLNVKYPVLQDHYRSIRRALLRTVSAGKLYGQDGKALSVHALKDISFELKDGDRLGLVGRNGAGKSTLLRTLGGFILPDSGQLSVHGKVTALFSVNGGMDIERSGYDNIILMGRLLGIAPNEMRKHIPDIEEFSELGEFLSLPVRSYSDGMKVRLGFSIVTCLSPEILILDEAIGAGDAHFLEKATKRAQELYQRARIIVMASHAPGILRGMCNKALWLDHGQIVKIGDVEEVLTAYEQSH